MPVIVTAQNSSTHFLLTAPLLILSCTVDASLTNMIGPDSWLIDKVASCKGIINKDIYITFNFNLKQQKVHSSLSFKKKNFNPKFFLWFVSSWCFRHFSFDLHNSSSVFSSLYKVEEEQHKTCLKHSKFRILHLNIRPPIFYSHLTHT